MSVRSVWHVVEIRYEGLRLLVQFVTVGLHVGAFTASRYFRELLLVCFLFRLLAVLWSNGSCEALLRHVESLEFEDEEGIDDWDR